MCDEEQFFQLLTDFKTWKDGEVLDERRMMQHELVLAHLARLYGSINWNTQVFGLCPPYKFCLDIQGNTLSKLVAVTVTGKLMVCRETKIPKCDNYFDNNGLFVIAQPYPLPEPLWETQLHFPLYQLELEWRKWQQGIEEIVKAGDGIPLGRYLKGQWDKYYIPPVQRVAASDDLQNRIEKLMKNVADFANDNIPIQTLVLELSNRDWANLTPLAFWEAHCRCLVALLANPKIAANNTYKNNISDLVSGFIPWDFDIGLGKLEYLWKLIDSSIRKNKFIGQRAEITSGKA